MSYGVRPAEKRKRGGVQAIFCEFFAGKGVLSREVARLGVKVLPPDEVTEGGTDFGSKTQVEKLKEKLKELAEETAQLIIHLAPPCATFSRARDRSAKTRLRSNAWPEGLPGKQGRTRHPNLLAKRAFDLANWAADELNAWVTLENPRRSYIWQYVRRQVQTSGLGDHGRAPLGVHVRRNVPEANHAPLLELGPDEAEQGLHTEGWHVQLR